MTKTANLLLTVLLFLPAGCAICPSPDVASDSLTPYVTKLSRYVERCHTKRLLDVNSASSDKILSTCTGHVEPIAAAFSGCEIKAKGGADSVVVHVCSKQTGLLLFEDYSCTGYLDFDRRSDNRPCLPPTISVDEYCTNPPQRR